MGLFDALGRAAGQMAAGAYDGWSARMSKADEGIERAPGGSRADTAINAPVPTEKAAEPPKSLFFDPWAVLDQLGFKERATPMSFQTINHIVQKCPVVGAVIHSRVTQVASFSRVQVDRYGFGHRVRLRDRAERVTPAAKRHIERQHTFLQRTGTSDNPRGRDNFDTFLRKVAKDSLRYDQMAFEVVPTRGGQPAEFYAVDASSMRLADASRLGFDEDFSDAIRYVQVWDGMVVNEYTQDELCFGVRNPSTDLRLNGYGYSEIEQALIAITGLLNGFDYNQRFFSQGSGVKGVLNFRGAIQESQLDKFRQQFYSMLSGVQNSWRTPIINAEDMQWVPLQGMSNTDMEFSAWIDFLIKVFCAFFHMDPAEINFNYGNIGQSQSLNQENNAERVNDSREKGLRPVLDFLAHTINTHIIWPINESFIFEFVGLESATADQAADLAAKRVRTSRTVNEVRSEDDLPPLPHGDIILDSVYLQNAATQDQQAQTGAPVPQAGNPGSLDLETLKRLLTGEPAPANDAPGMPDQPQDADQGTTEMKTGGDVGDADNPVDDDGAPVPVAKSRLGRTIIDVRL